MTNKQLSPAAQAVLDAVNKVYWDWGHMLPASSDTITAAALREVVNQLQYYNCLEGEDMLLDARAILDVADELEAL
jgi:hypothetical protein